MSERTDDLYFVGADGVAFVKVGHSKNPQARLRTLRTGSPYKLHLLCTYTDAGHLEPYIKNALRDRGAMNGEWFLRGETDFDALVREATLAFTAEEQRPRRESPLPYNLGREIRIARLRKDWKQHDLCEATGLSQKYLSEIELEKVDPRFSIVHRIAQALGVSLDQLAQEEVR